MIEMSVIVPSGARLDSRNTCARRELQDIDLVALIHRSHTSRVVDGPREGADLVGVPKREVQSNDGTGRGFLSGVGDITGGRPIEGGIDPGRRRPTISTGITIVGHQGIGRARCQSDDRIGPPAGGDLGM